MRAQSILATVITLLTNLVLAVWWQTKLVSSYLFKIIITRSKLKLHAWHYRHSIKIC